MRYVLKLYFSLIVCFFVFSLNIYGKKFKYADGIFITEKGIEIKVQLADTKEKRNLGLGKRDFLSNDMGMLFIFEKKKYHTFWMKDMRFPIDIVWIDNRIIVDIKKNIKPSKNNDRLILYKPSKPSNFVLEINAGIAEKIDLKIGGKVQYKF